jgi:hypothetical protein
MSSNAQEPDYERFKNLPKPIQISPPSLEKPQPDDRVRRLTELLNNPEWERDYANIRGIIGLYNEGKIKAGEIVYAQDGKTFSEKPSPIPGSAIWVEVSIGY